MPCRSSGSRVVLVVDGDAVHGAGLARRLGARCAVRVAPTAREAAAWLQREAVDLVVLDVTSESGDGFAVLSLVAAMARRPKVIALAPAGEIMPAVRAVQLGADDCVARRPQGDGVLAAVRRALRDSDDGARVPGYRARRTEGRGRLARAAVRLCRPRTS